MADQFDIHDLNHFEIQKALALASFYAYGGDVEGHVAEFGTNTGRTARHIALAMRQYEMRLESKGRAVHQPKHFHLFDSFQGMPPAKHEADKTSPGVLSGTWAEGSLRTLTAEQLYAHISKILGPKRVLVFEGFYSQTLSRIPPETRYSLVNMDSTLYFSTFEVLDHLFGRRYISEGAIFLFKGWNANRAKNDAGERRAWHEAKEKHKIVASEPTYFAWQGVKFFIHDYEGMPKS